VAVTSQPKIAAAAGTVSVAMIAPRPRSSSVTSRALGRSRPLLLVACPSREHGKSRRSIRGESSQQAQAAAKKMSVGGGFDQGIYAHHLYVAEIAHELFKP
jgi:hypothetical protein